MSNLPALDIGEYAQLKTGYGVVPNADIGEYTKSDYGQGVIPGFNIGEFFSAGAVNYEQAKKYIVRTKKRTVVVNSREEAEKVMLLDGMAEENSELNSPADVNVSDNTKNAPESAKQPLKTIKPVIYDFNLMLETLQSQANAEYLANQQKYMALIQMYEQFIEDEEIELLLMAA